MAALIAAHYQRITTRPGEARDTLESRVDWLAQAIAIEAQDVMREIGGSAQCDLSICTTMLSQHVTQNPSGQQRLMSGISALLGTDPAALVKAYQCASWGYVMRLLHSGLMRDRTVVISIVDIDLHDFCYWEHNPNWGASGFGIATLALDLGTQAPPFVSLGVAQSNSVIEFGRSLGKFARENAAELVAVPFFPEEQWNTFQLSVGAARLTDNLHTSYGHCFGADPWIGLITKLKQTEGAAPATVVAGSLSLSGYYATARLTLPSDLTTRVKCTAMH